VWIYTRQKIIILIVILSFVVCPRAYALSNYYFDFSLADNVLSDGQECPVKFEWNIKDVDTATQTRFTVKPHTSAGAVEIYNEDLKKFVGTAEASSQFPNLQQEMLVKFSGVQSSENPIPLKFIIFDTLTDQIYETPVKKVWGTAYYKKYMGLLNESILKPPTDDGTVTDIVIDGIKPADPIKIYLWYLGPAFFLYGLLKSPNGFS
jgi:hypothetical protein